MAKRTSGKIEVRYDGPAVRVGDYVPGQVYAVDAEEARRLIQAKGFVAVEDEDEEG